MTPLQINALLDRVQRNLRALEWGRVMLAALIGATSAFGCVSVARAVYGAPSDTFGWMFASTVGFVVLFWRIHVVQPNRVQRVDAALWAERVSPALRYSLVTLAEQERAGNATDMQLKLAAFASNTAWADDARSAMRDRRVRLVAKLTAMTMLLGVAAYPWHVGALSALATETRVTNAASAVTERGRVRAELTLLPPPYTARETRTLAFGETISALVGSVLRVDGFGDVGTATLLLQEASDSGAGLQRRVMVVARDGGWRGVIRIGALPIALRLRDPLGERWLLVTPVVDSAPVATLTIPASDTLVFDTTASIRIAGTIHDDIGLRDARIEYIISSGGGEQFTFKSGVLSERRGVLGRDLPLATTLNLGTLGLKPGDLVHLRFTAHDGNTLSGPSLGTSETRTIRIPRADERDSVSVEQLPPSPVDKSVLSQRQLLLLTERLVARMPRLDRPTMVAESRRLGADQARLRKQVSDIVFARLGDNPSGEHAHFPGDGHDHSAEELSTQRTPEEVLKAADRATGGVGTLLDSHGDETPVVAVNRPLLEAYNAMWDATRALQGGVPREALEPMRRALAAIQRARSAERIYLRGTPPAAVVDIEKVRLIGTDTANAESRRALTALPAPDRRLAERVLRGMSLLVSDQSSALDSLRLVRLDALGAAPSVAVALGEAIDALERGRNATAALLRVRRLALAPWQSAPGASLWLNGTP
jgi:hypothetical protein